MSLLLTALLAGSAHAASLDLIEVGGNWGTPGATDATALWWNPAGLAVRDNTSFTLEGAPLLAQVNWDRPDPGYAPVDRKEDRADEGMTYDYSGSQTLKFTGVVPFLGVKTNFGVPGLGVGAGMAVPYAHSGNAEDPDGIGRYQVREGNIQTIYGMLGAAYDIADKVSIGVTGEYYLNTWDVNVDTESVSAIRDNAEAQFEGFGANWVDADLENPAYATNLDFDHLRDSGVTFGAGAHIHPSDDWALSIAYQHGAKLNNTGDVALTFTCPPTEDTLGTLGAKQYGLCDGENPDSPVVMNGEGGLAYNLPGRVQAGFVLTSVPKLRLELMGAYVMWHVFDDYAIHTAITPDDVTLVESDDQKQKTVDLVSQDRLWARDSRDTFWTGLDGKYRFSKIFLGGARVLYDHSAIPTSALATSNFDANLISASLLGVVKPSKSFDIGLSAGHQFYFTRTVTDSAFDLRIDPAERHEDRYNYQNSNGTYSGGVTRFGLSVRGHFGGGGDDAAADEDAG